MTIAGMPGLTGGMPGQAVGGLAQMPTGVGSKPFMSPWLDFTTVALPDSHQLVMWWAQYLWLTDGNFRTAMERVAAHFITTIEFPDLEPDEESTWKELFLTHLNYRLELQGCAHDYLCFHGDTKTTTRDGVFKLRDLVGKTVDVLSQGGVYRPAEFKSFGRQRLLEVEFSDGRTVLATPEHQWVVLKSTGGTVRVPTTKLAGRRIERTVAERPLQGDEYREGVRHGFVFGDGSTYNHGKQGVANFFGHKDSALLPFFEGVGSPPRKQKDKDLIKIHGVPASYKTLPSPTKSAEYWYGFVCGFLSADGSVDTYGCAILTQKSKATLEAIAEQLPRIGMAGGPVRGHWRRADLSSFNGKADAVYEGEMHYLTLLKRFMIPEDFIVTAHRAKFEAGWTKTNYGRFVGVVDVRETGIVDEVFCCVEPKTHTFVIDNGVLTGNCYGNSFVTAYLPFKRFVRCRQCSLEQPISEVSYRLKFTQADPYLVWGRTQRCMRCGDNSAYEVFDRRDPDLSRVRLNRYDPTDIELAYNRFSQKKDFRWRIPDEVRADIQTSARIHIDDTPIEVLQTVAVNGRLRFDDQMILHQAEPSISGIRTHGWGIPRSISNFRTAWLQQLTNKMDQAIAIDYTMGMRLMSPTPTPGGQDPMVTHSMEQFVQRMNQIVNNHRANPTGFYTMPYPVNYQFVGAEGANMLQPDKLKFRQQEYLNQLGVPLEYHQMSLSTQAAPMALRLFEAYWQSIPTFYNRTLDWIVKLLSRVYGLEVTTVRMQKTTIADDMERKNVLLQLMSANQLSPQTALQPFGIDAHTEVKKVFQNQAFVAKVQQEFDEREAQRQEMGALKGMAANPSPASLAAQQQAGGGGAPPPGTPTGGVPTGGMPGGQQTATSLSAMSDQAEQIAQQLAPLDDYTRKQQLRALREGNKDLHALVMSNLEQIRGAAASQGQQMILQQGQPQ